MENKNSRRGLIWILIAALTATISIIAVLAKVIRDFSTKLNTTDGEDYIPDWSEDEAFDLELSEEPAPADEETPAAEAAEGTEA